MSERAPRADAGEVARPGEIVVLIVAGYPAVRAGLGALLASDPGIVAVEPGASQPVALDRADVGPDVVVADLAGLPEETADDLAVAYPRARFVLLGADPALDGPGLSAGPVAYLAPDADATALAAAVHGVAAGLTVLDPALAAPGAPLRAEPAPELGSERGEPLTPRERQVLALVADGLPNKAIARALGISEHTAKFHVGSLLSKLGAGSRTEAVTIATRRGLLHV